MTKDLAELKSPPHKIIAFLKKGRDRLREKYRQLREKLRVAENQVRAVTKIRDAWRACHIFFHLTRVTEAMALTGELPGQQDKIPAAES